MSLLQIQVEIDKEPGVQRTDRYPQKFWETKSLEEMTKAEWETLCDRCGRCCLHKVEDEETGEVLYTSVACKLYELNSSTCGNYFHRKQFVPECMVLTVQEVRKLTCLPQTCAYRLLAEGKSLPEWHPLISGDPQSVIRFGMSINRFAISETMIDMRALDQYILER